MTWRLIGSLDTLALSWSFTGDIVVAGTIALGGDCHQDGAL
ncbi:DUF2061 domain-containing protein [Methylobacterium sp. NFXW15]